MKMRRTLQKIAKPQYDEVKKMREEEVTDSSSIAERLGYKNFEDHQLLPFQIVELTQLFAAVILDKFPIAKVHIKE